MDKQDLTTGTQQNVWRPVTRICILRLELRGLSPEIKMHILLAVLHTFLIELHVARRICLNIKTDLILGDHFLYSRHLTV